MSEQDEMSQEATEGETQDQGGKRSLQAILDDLSQPVPDRLTEDKTLKGNKITYIPWYRVQKLLNHFTNGFWEYEITGRETIHAGTDHSTGQPNRDLALTVRIYIHTTDGTFFREGTGIESTDVDSFGDPQSNAESMAFRRAAARWGVGLDLYEG